MSISKKDLSIETLMLKTNEFPVVKERFLLKETLERMNQYKLGVACIVDNNQKLKGVFTDGDFRRLILKSQRPLSRIFIEDIIDIVGEKFFTIDLESTLGEAIESMEIKKIWDLPVVNKKGILKGLVHLHPVIKKIF